MPVYWFAISQTEQLNIRNAVLSFIILHLFIYPASNGYNSYMDRDTESIGGVRYPQPPGQELFYASIFLDVMGILLSCFIGIEFMVGLVAYIVASKLYSYRGVRLKKYPILGYLTVVFFQGAVVFFILVRECSENKDPEISMYTLLSASMLIGGFYPLTQIYQHRQDAADGVQTLSRLLGYKGTFVFAAMVYTSAMIILGFYLIPTLKIIDFVYFQMFFIPTFIYFLWWFIEVIKNTEKANYTNTMRMNTIASVCSSAAFIFLLWI